MPRGRCRDCSACPSTRRRAAIRGLHFRHDAGLPIKPLAPQRHPQRLASGLLLAESRQSITASKGAQWALPPTTSVRSVDILSLETRLLSHQALGVQGMSLITEPAALTAAAGNLADIGSAMSATNAVGGRPDHRARPGRRRRGVGADRGSVRRPRAAVPGGRRASVGDSPTVRRHLAASRRFVSRPPRPPTRPPRAENRE